MMDRYQTLADVAEIVMGQSPPGHTCNTDRIGVPLLNGPTEFGPHHPRPVQYTTDPRKRAYPGDILFCVRGSTTGRMNWADREYAIGRGIAAIRHREHPELQPLVRAVIEHALPELLAQATGSTFPNVSYDLLATIPWPSLPLPEQRAIAHILSTLDDKIELLRRMNETLEAMARVLFKSWFVDFDPVIDNALEAGNPIPDELKGKAKRRLALGERRKPLPEHIRRLFPDRFVDSELGPIPDGWKIRSLDEIAEYLNGVAWQKYRAKEGEPSLPVIKIRELREGITSASDRASMHVPEEYIVEDGDVLFSWSGSLLVKIWCGGKGVLNQHLFKVSSKHYPKWFYYLWTSEHLGRFQRIAADKATTMGHIKRSHLSESYVLVPNSTLLGKMTAIIEPLIENQIANEIACRTLANIRDTLLPKLISGEIGVSDAEKFVKEAL